MAPPVSIRYTAVAEEGMVVIENIAGVHAKMFDLEYPVGLTLCFEETMSGLGNLVLVRSFVDSEGEDSIVVPITLCFCQKIVLVSGWRTTQRKSYPATSP